MFKKGDKVKCTNYAGSTMAGFPVGEEGIVLEHYVVEGKYESINMFYVKLPSGRWDLREDELKAVG